MDAHRQPGHRALRRGRWSLQGQVYLVTASTIARAPMFSVFEPAWAACRAMDAFERHGDTRLLAWVLMPDHAHWLLQLGASESLPMAVNRLKTTTARNANRVLQRAGALWDRGSTIGRCGAKKACWWPRVT